MTVKRSLRRGYGPRLFGRRGFSIFHIDRNINQFDNAVKMLTDSSTSRKAVIQLFRADDIIRDRKDVPCTCTIQFLVREKKLDMVVFMRIK